MLFYLSFCNVGDWSDDEDLNEEISSEFEGGFSNIIVVDNLPVVPKEKLEKLEGVVRKIYSQIGLIKEDGLWLPVDPATQKTLGYCFIEYNTPQVQHFQNFGYLYSCKLTYNTCIHCSFSLSYNTENVILLLICNFNAIYGWKGIPCESIKVEV